MRSRRSDTAAAPLRAAAALLAGAVLSFLPLLVPCAGADIYRWVDSQGTVHFSDDLTLVPPAEREKATLHIREAPGTREPLPPPGAAPAFGPDVPPPPASAGEDPGDAAERDREELLSRIEQLEAKIAAKEQHIAAIDLKRSLAVNPLGNKFVDPSDLDLYAKYQAELPADRDRLRRLEEELDRLR